MRIVSILASLILLLTACAQKPEIASNSDPTQEFGGYKTFSWAKDDPMVVFGLLGPTPRTKDKLVSGIRENLEAKGFSFSEDRQNVDFLVQFTVGARDGAEIWNIPNEYNDRTWWGHPYYGTRAVVNRYTEGKLAIDVIDQVRQIPVWHGYASKRLSKEELNNPDPNVRPAIDEVLATFPPKG